MDAFLLKKVVAELAEELPGALVSKVRQPGEKEIVLELWTGRGEKRLLLSADPELCRLHLTTRKAPNPPTQPRFCQFLRKHLEGMRIARFSLAPYDRSVRIDFSSSRPDAEHARTTLHAELFGRHANLIYADGEGTILCPLRSVSAEESRIREVAAGIPYRPLPPPERVFLPDVTEEVARRIFSGGWEGLPKSLMDAVAGIGKEVAQEAAARGRDGAGALHQTLRELVRRYEEGDFAQGIGTLPNGKKRILPFPCPAAGFGEFVPFPAANTAADAFYAEVAEGRELSALRQQLKTRIAALLKKERQKLSNVGGDEERQQEGMRGGAHGETIKANLGALKKGMDSFRDIPLDPAKTPVENMNRYFHLARKAKGAMEIVRKRKREVAESVFYLESLESQLAEAVDREGLIAVRQELSSSYAPKRKPAARKKSRPQDAPRPVIPQVTKVEFRGHAILVGRNNVGNDRIVKELSAPDDMWLHAQGIPGSHVLVKRTAGKEVPKEVVEEAARLAVLHSRAKGSQNVPVFLAEARHVSKFKGAKPGLVRIAKYSTVFVR